MCPLAPPLDHFRHLAAYPSFPYPLAEQPAGRMGKGATGRRNRFNIGELSGFAPAPLYPGLHIDILVFGDM